ncbi:MAG: pilin [Patescibacteria group bacterium]
MKKKILKNLVSMAMLLLITMPILALSLNVQTAAADEVTPEYLFGGEDEIDVGDTIGLGARDPREIAASVINIILGFLGIIAVVIILLGGFKWMTAGGNEDKVSEARKLIMAGIVGLVIILASFAIAKFVINSILGATLEQ